VPYSHKPQSNRFELKYIIGERSAQGIRDFLRGRLELDEHAQPDQANAYPVFSLYLDTPTLTLFRQTTQGLKNRFKLRIRFYDDDAGSPAFLEIKRRITDVISKERTAICREGVRRLLDGGWPDESHLMGTHTNGRRPGTLQQFWRLCDAIGAKGCVYVSYLREAYVSPNSDQVRITFDRRLSASPYEPGSELSLPSEGIRPEMGGVILEIKFTDRFPQWMRKLAQAFGLQRLSVPKYVKCVEAMGFQSLAGLGINRRVAQWTTG